MSHISLHRFLWILVPLGIISLKGQPQVQGAFGAVTIDGKIWNQIALRPVIPIGKWGVALDLVFYIDEDGNLHKDEWDFSSGEASKNTIIDKIYYIRYGFPNQPLYFKVGALDQVDMGYGILVSQYSNSIQYPSVRKVGLDFGFRRSSLFIEGFSNDFKENLGLVGFRAGSTNIFSVPVAASFVIDRNQFLGLKDRDGDGRPDIVDDFPENNMYWLDSDDDGIADADPAEWDIDGDGITDTLDSDIPGWDQDTILVLDTDIWRKNEPLNVRESQDDISAIAVDVAYPIIREEKLSVTLYAQAAKMIGETDHPNQLGEKLQLGTGLVPVAISAKFGPARFNLEYRMIPQGQFEFGYWNRSYEIERVSFSSTSSGNVTIRTKESQLGRYGKQKGFYAQLGVSLGSYLAFSSSYQNLNGDIWDDVTQEYETQENSSFLSILSLSKSISRIKKAQGFYQQRNVPNPFKFEYSESTIMGYEVGIELGSGMVLMYKFQRSFRDLNGDGSVDGPNETVNNSTVETSFMF
ncbi:MAG: hypothetical protein HOD97_05890 [Candidatus Marinimicrobia bacterium]|jgi:hypothetical protein|nr:hypothetical protein [Candidatus Neomarinimicrobiota bacterium]MBT3617479.1 hypothetical protein [Candidatus Neomarinimicrobiota bacterium]MBT3829419.1 hypothetical protein [Candidatus Neomarinimicrobiota bacterium]MBT3996999.1 hypothetical protein [Candidatus Neomarinimicrobiota bacterium]MBT4281125.1 hypothetical protein [Candidatus Neomarinimicrobiota bacterium]